jgi:class 3 adenylate cyclase/tetratricopeptide (TPR) repeat protein
LVVTCLDCGSENADSAKFCSECAAPLAVLGGERWERRVVSVVFADLVGFTAKSDQLDVEDVQGFLGRYHELLRHELERHGGTVEKFIGDAVMALFGAPVAHEDDPERAVRSALAIQDSVGEMRESDGVDLRVRVGVTTGEALVALGVRPESGEGMATGDVVNTASRLQGAAPVDGVLVDERTHRATDRSIRYAEGESIAVKGKSRPLAVWRALETRSLLPEQSRGDDVALVGRRHEVAQLVAALERSREEPSAQLVTVVGAPGIGKTRLVTELRRYVEELPGLTRWRRGRSLAYGEGIAFWALGEMVKGEAGILESDPAESTARKLDKAVAVVMTNERDRGWAARHLRPLVGLDAPPLASREGGLVEAFAAWRRFFEAVAVDRPTVLVFEDVHWADDALLDFIELLAERAGAVPLLVVCTARPEIVERRPVWGGGMTNAQTILLAPLQAEDTARLVAELLDGPLSAGTLLEDISSQAEGNPLYAQEYVRMLRDRGLLVRDGRGSTLVAEPESSPDSVLGIIAARLDTLSADERALVQDAAVVGRTAWVGAAAAISERPAWELGELLYGLERKQLVRRVRQSSIEGEVEFSFAHALIQEVAYGQIRRVERAEKHERTAGWIEHIGGERKDKAELLAHHYTAALTLREQAGEDPASVRARAVDALIEAGRQALAVNVYQAANRHLKSALDLLDEGDVRRAELVLDIARTHISVNETDEHLLLSARDLQVGAENWEGAAWAEYLLGWWARNVPGDGERADRHYAASAEYAARIPYRPISGLVAAEQAFRLLGDGRHVEAADLIDRTLPHAQRAGDRGSQGILLYQRAFARFEAGELEGVEDNERSVQILAGESHPKTPIAYNNLAFRYTGAGRLDDALKASDEAVNWAARFGEPHLIADADGQRAEILTQMGEWDEALRLVTPRLGSNDRLLDADARGSRGWIVLARGDPATALTDGSLILEYGRTGQSREYTIYGLALRAAALRDTRSGDAATAFRTFWQESLTKQPFPPFVAELAARVEGDAERREFRGIVERMPERSPWKVAIAATLDRRHHAAAALYREIGARPLEAHAHLLAARTASAEGRHSDAAQHAGQALDFYQAAGATFFTDQAAKLLRAPP